MKSQGSARSCEALTEEFRANGSKLYGERLVFSGVGGRDVYNISAPFLDEGEWIIAGRVEARDSEFSEVVFFAEKDGVWSPRVNARTFQNLQDPFFTHVGDELVFGGVEVWANPYAHNKIQYRTAFYRGQNVRELTLFCVGPQWMKDIRLVELKDGTIGVFTRPNGPFWGGQAQIGWVVIPCLEELTASVISNAEPIPERFLDGEWGGANEAHLLDNGVVGVLGHISYRTSDGYLHYRPMTFLFDPVRLVVSPIQVIAERSCFPPCEPKRPDLIDVVFSGGLVRHDDGTAYLYAGISDTEAHRILISDPFC